MKPVREEEDKNAFVGAFKKEIAQFRLHVSRIKNQYTQLRYLKDNLPAHDVIIQWTLQRTIVAEVNKRYNQLIRVQSKSRSSQWSFISKKETDAP